MVGHLVRVDRATPLALENVPMGRLGPWLDPVTQLTLSGVSVLVLAAVGISVAARNKIYADTIHKTGTWNLGALVIVGEFLQLTTFPACSRRKIFSISSCFLRYFTAATLLIFIYRSIPIISASFWSTPTPMLRHTALIVPSSTMDRILDLIRPFGYYVGLSKVQVRPVRPPASPTRLAPANLMSTTLKLLPWITAEQYLVYLLNIFMTTSMLWKFLMAAASSGAVLNSSIRLNFHGLLFAAGGIVLAITRHVDTRLSRVAVELIEQSVGGANAILALEVVASLPALVLWQNSWLSIVSALALDPYPMLTSAPSPLPWLHCSDWGPLTLCLSMAQTSAVTTTSFLRPLISPSQRGIRTPHFHMWSFSLAFFNQYISRQRPSYY
jgi:hypothetical protein